VRLAQLCTPHTARATPSHFRARLTIACHAPEPSSTSRIPKAPMRIGRLLRIVLTYRILSHPVLSYPIQSISYSLIRDDSTAWQVNTFTMNMLVQTFTTMVLVLQADCFGTHPVSPPSDETFDYIIVGSGPGGAGALLGLIEHDPSANILLLERGKNLLSPSPSGGVLAATTGATADCVASEGATTFIPPSRTLTTSSSSRATPSAALLR